MRSRRGARAQDLCARYPIASIEDPFDENDFAGFAALTSAIGQRVQVHAPACVCPGTRSRVAPPR